MRYRYTKLINDTAPRPYLRLYLRNGFYTTVESIYGLVDSGADWIIAPMDPAVDEVKLDLSRAPVRSFRGTTGKLQRGKLADICIIVLTEDGQQAFDKPSKCVFCDTLDVAGGLLLGQDGFFSHFRTVFHQPDNYFEIEPWDVVQKK